MEATSPNRPCRPWRTTCTMTSGRSTTTISNIPHMRWANLPRLISNTRWRRPRPCVPTPSRTTSTTKTTPATAITLTMPLTTPPHNHHPPLIHSRCSVTTPTLALSTSMLALTLLIQRPLHTPLIPIRPPWSPVPPPIRHKSHRLIKHLRAINHSRRPIPTIQVSDLHPHSRIPLPLFVLYFHFASLPPSFMDKVIWYDAIRCLYAGRCVCVCVCVIGVYVWVLGVNKMAGCLDVMIYLGVIGWGSNALQYAMTTTMIRRKFDAQITSVAPPAVDCLQRSGGISFAWFAILLSRVMICRHRILDYCCSCWWRQFRCCGNGLKWSSKCNISGNTQSSIPVAQIKSKCSQGWIDFM